MNTSVDQNALKNTVQEQGTRVGQAAGEESRHIAGTAGDQARQVTHQAVGRATGLVEDVKAQTRQQADVQVSQLGKALARLEQQGQALVDGRPQDSGPLAQYAGYGITMVGNLADQIQNRGTDGLIEDVQTFARRRPGLFLMGALGLGIGVGRLLKAGSAQSGGQVSRGGVSPTDNFSDQPYGFESSRAYENQGRIDLTGPPAAYEAPLAAPFGDSSAPFETEHPVGLPTEPGFAVDEDDFGQFREDGPARSASKPGIIPPAEGGIK